MLREPKSIPKNLFLNKLKIINKLYHFLKIILSPKFCLLCFKQSDFYICPNCWQEKFKLNLSCLECNRRIIDVCSIKHHSILIKALINFGNYEEKELTKIVILGKDTAFEILKDIGHWISQDFRNNKLLEKIRDFYLVPVPLSKNKLIQRGYNQSLIICQALAEETGLKIFTGLEKIKETKDQATLNHQKRSINLQNVFQVSGFSPQKIILVDDIKTTGSTLKECAKVLKKKGAKEIIALTILK